jgi:hypothetical protein
MTLFIYSIIPSLMMTIFNELLIIQIFKLGSNLNTTDRRLIEVNKKNKRHLTFSLIIITLFVILPICISRFVIFLEFFYHSTLFFNLFFTIIYLKNAVYRFLGIK